MIGGLGTLNISFSVRQVYNGLRYTIETNATSLNGKLIIMENLYNAHFLCTVIVYDCPVLASGCSSCLSQNINTEFNCSWCSYECRDRSDCNNGHTISTGNCPWPNITSFNPEAGPPAGGTIITINGTNLGTQESDIESIRIGTRDCSIDEYQVGKSIICTISIDPNETTDRNDTVTVRVRWSSGTVAANSAVQFQFITPTVVSFSPSFGPVSGGTEVNVKGTNLNIGNKVMTRIIMRNESSSRNTQCPDVNCNIMYVMTDDALLLLLLLLLYHLGVLLIQR